MARPGFYRSVLERAGVESCQVNSFEAIFCESEQPDLLRQDLCITPLSIELNLADHQAATGIAATTLDDMHAIIDWYFARYGTRAVAVKCGAAYMRRLNFAAVPAEDAARLDLTKARLSGRLNHHDSITRCPAPAYDA